MNRKLQFLFRRSRAEREINDELRFHIEAHVARSIQAGASPEEARYRAMREFGAVELWKEECRDTRGLNLLESILQDARYGFRTIVRKPGFMLTAVLTLALGIGVNIALFSLINAVVLRPLPYAEPDRLVQLWNTRTSPAEQIPITPGDFLDWRERITTLDGLAAYSENGVNWTSHAEPERLAGARVTARFFELLGVDPIIGRRFDGELERSALLSHAFWVSRFGGDRGVLGRSMTIDGTPYTIIGVMPREFHFAAAGTVDVWLPWNIPEGARGDRYSHYLMPIGRLKAGITFEQAEAEQMSIAKALASANPGTNTGWGANLNLLREDWIGPIRPALWILICAVALVLAIGCGNVANLLIAQSTSREREMAIRSALGASRWRIVRQLLVEGAILCAAGTALGLVFALWAVPLVVRSLPGVLRQYMPYLYEIPFDYRLMAFVAAVAIAATLAASLAPAVQAARRGTVQSREQASRSRLRGVLVASQAALAALLIVAAGLALRSLERLLQVEPGFQPKGVLSMRVSLPASKYRDPARRVAAQEQFLHRLEALPGVHAAATTTIVPLSGMVRMSAFNIVGREDPAWKMPSCDYWTVSPGYFETLAVPIRAGRRFTAQDHRDAPKVLVINETLARNFFPNLNPIGQRLVVGRVSLDEREIVGIAGDVHGRGLDLPIAPAVYLPATQDALRDFAVVIRADGDRGAITRASRAALLEVEKDVTIFSVATMESVMAGSPTHVVRRVPSVAMTVLAVAALLLVAIGLGGLLSSTVSQRTREIGVRMAIGANGARVVRMILGYSLRLALAGVAVGLAVAALLSQFAKSWLFGVSALDAPAYIGSAVLLIAVGIAAAWLPARRATRIDPAQALRCE